MLRKLLLAVLTVVAAPLPAQADWYEAGSKHFVVYSDDSPDRIRSYTERLERFDQALRKITGTPDKPLSPSARVTVYLVSDVGAVQKLYGGSGVGGFFQRRASGSVAFAPRKSGGYLDAQTIMLHEYGHNFMYSAWPGVVFAKWFSEGFAEFVGTAIFRDDGTLLIGKNPDYRSYGISKSNYMPAERLVELNMGELDPYESEALYARGWLLTHYLILGGHVDQLLGYIQAINAGKSVAEANRVFGNLRTLDAKITAYAKRPSLPSIALAPGQVPIGEVTLRKVSAGEAAVMPARIASSRGVDPERAKEVVAMARRLAAPYPNDAAAQNELAEAEFDAGNHAAAEAAADRALAADPKSVHALLYKGMAQMEIAQTAGVTDTAKWKAIRGWFIAANKLETEYAQPLILFYDSFEAAKQKPVKSAEDGLLYAYVLAPYDPSLRFQAGRVLLQQNRVEPARIAFETIAFAAHGDKTQTNIADDILKALDSGGSAAALKVVADAEAKAKAAEEEAKKKAAKKG